MIKVAPVITTLVCLVHQAAAPYGVWVHEWINIYFHIGIFVQYMFLQQQNIYITCGSGESWSKVKVRSYIARYPVCMTAQSALHFTPWQTCSFQGHLNFSGKHSATLQLR